MLAIRKDGSQGVNQRQKNEPVGKINDHQKRLMEERSQKVELPGHDPGATFEPEQWSGGVARRNQIKT
jgi:hypothetical protein